MPTRPPGDVSNSAIRCGGSSSDARHPPARLDPPAERLQLGDERAGQHPGAALGERPAVDVCRGAEHEPGRRADRLGQRQDRVGGDPREQRPGGVAPEASRDPRRRLQSQQPEPRHPQRPRRRQRHVERAEQVRQQRRRGVDHPAEQVAVRVAVAAQPAGRLVDVAAEQDRGAVVERVAERRRRSIQRRPCAARAGWRSAKNGEIRPKTWIELQTSWTKPGSVSSAERDPPPGSSAASRTVTRRPARASVIAAASPFGPEPTTTASTASRASARPAPPVTAACLARLPRRPPARTAARTPPASVRTHHAPVSRRSRHVE